MKNKLNVFFTILLVFVSQIGFAQKTINGTVSDSNGPLPGVTIIVAGTNQGVVSDFDGTFSITANNGDVLEFSYIGMENYSVTVSDTNNLQIVMNESATALDEIIVSGVAGGTTVKKMTVSITKVRQEQLSMAPASSVAGALVGKVAGARVSMSSGAPGAGFQLQLRSDNNLNAGSSPLIIMDGVIINTSLNDINVDDIESMEVVKGAAASSLYGSRAANGVIAITSKRGSGVKKGSSSVTVRSEMGFQQIANYIDISESHSFALASDWQNHLGAYTAYDGVSFPAGYMGGYNPLITGSRKEKADHYMDNPFGVNRDHQKDYFTVGETQTNFASFSSNGEKTNVYGSFERTKQTGVVPYTDGFNRKNFRLNIDHEIKPWLNLSISNLYTDNSIQFPGGGGGFFAIVLAEPDNDLNMANPVDGQPHYLRHNHWSNEGNPYYYASKYEQATNTTSWISNIKTEIKFNQYLSLDLKYSKENINSNYTGYAPYDTWGIGSGGNNDYGLIITEGSLYKSNSVTIGENTQAILNFSRKFNELKISSKLSVLDEKRSYEGFDVGGIDFAIRDLPTLEAFKEVNSWGSQNTKENARNYFGIVGLDYKDRYLVDIMFRRDGSSLFGADNRWANYYRASGAYIISEDISIPGIQNLKVRAAQGTAGIRPGFNWQYETYNISNGLTSPGQKGNNALKPSQTEETEFGLDVSFLNTFTFQATQSKSVTTNQFLAVPLIPFVSDGFTSQWQNAGTVEGNTLEMSLSANWKNKKDFKWNSNIVFAKSEQKITALPIAPYQSGPDGLYFIKEGESYGSIYGYTWVETLEQMSNQLPNGKTISDYEVNSDGFVVPAGSQGTTSEKSITLKNDNGDLAFVKIGDGLPKFTMGISNSISYKNASFYFLFDIKNGGDVYNRKSQWMTRDTRNGIMDMANVPEGEKKTTDYFLNFYDVNSNNSYWVEDASFIKLREVALGYTLNDSNMPTSISNIFKSITAKVIGRNLLTFTEYSGYDPEVGSIRNPFDGTDTYPNYRNIALSLTLDF